MSADSHPEPRPANESLVGGIDLGGTKIQAVVIDASNRVRGSARRATPTAGAARVVTALAQTLADAATVAGTDVRSLASAGVGTPGAVDQARGTVASAKNVSGFEKTVALAALLERDIGVRVSLGNDVGVALDAEAAIGAGADLASFVGVWWGTGIGGGVILNGKRWLGRGASGEIGHMIVRKNGALCPCGRRGCLEAYAGRRSMELRARRLASRGERTKLFEIMERKGLDRLTSGVWAKALERRDPLATKLVDRAVDALANGLASVVNLLDVDGVVVGGGLGTRLGAPMAERLAAEMQPHLFVPSRAPVVRTSQLGDLAGAVGAALLARASDAAISASP